MAKEKTEVSEKRIVVLEGDGIGLEVVREGVRFLKAIQDRLPFRLKFDRFPIGGRCLRKEGLPILPQTIESCQDSDAVLLGAVGDPRFDDNPPHLRPEKALLDLRASLGTYCNLRPAKIYPALYPASSLKNELVAGMDLLVVRELTGGIYFGQPSLRQNGPEGRSALDTMIYSEMEVARIARWAFRMAGARRGKVTSVDKANVLKSSQLWREVVGEIAEEFPEVALEHMLVDNCAMQLTRRPTQFDVILTGNMFGDILSDEASAITGSIGLLPSASLGDGAPLYEPVHGSAPDIAGQDKANPIAMIGAIAMMFQFTFGLPELARDIEKSIEVTLEKGFHTPDLALPGGQLVTTEEMTDRILEGL
ncbi:MAG: 3-isopropylmalate dehydrogenase [Calditrichaeota bacterium]|nr:3-isopropylmalate dehydrogenase [Calditrichota bacterium]HQU72756.1 3-isopropylmalate dehydrogenase [Calditrichia bacterium]